MAVLQGEQLNFALTNRIPRRALTLFFGWFSRLRQPLIRDLSIRLWQWFTPLDLGEARKRDFDSLHDCFIRELKAGVRPVDPDPAVVVSPCDGLVGAYGSLQDRQLLQAKDMAYHLDELLEDPDQACRFLGGCYVTLRITAAMYHRFHAPHDSRIRRVTYISGDAWNVNPPALRRVARLFCRNERAVIETQLAGSGHPLLLVPVAAVLVASIRLRFADVRLHLRYRGPNQIPCDATVTKGEELGWFEHGSTIIVVAPAGFSLCDQIREGSRVQVGQALLRLPATDQIDNPPD